MSFQEILGQDRAVRMLKRSAERPAHAYLFHGPEGVGKRLAAFSFIKTLFCLEKGEDCCGQCLPCQKVDRGTHPDVFLLEPDGDRIKIEKIREIILESGKKPFEESRKAFVIERAESMTEAAANALLKTLEEPPGSAVFILLCVNPDSLPSTVRSRCRAVPFGRLSPELIRVFLEREPSREGEETVLLMALSKGIPGRLAKFNLEQERVHRETILDLFGRLPRMTPPDLLALAKTMAGKKEEIPLLLEYGQEILRDLVLLRMGCDPGDVLNGDILNRLRSVSDPLSDRGLFECFRVFSEAERIRNLNPNPELLWDSALIQMTQAVNPL